MRASGGSRDFTLWVAMRDRQKWTSMDLLKLSQQFAPVQLWFFGRRLYQRPERVYIEVPVVRMFFLKSSLGFTSGLRFARMS